MTRITAASLRELTQNGQKIAALTAYDFPTARVLDESGIDIVLVGDSCGMALMGRPDTLGVTMDEMVHHTAMVSRAVERALVVADMPFLSYQVRPEDAVRNAGRLVVEGGAQAVKLEGPVERVGGAIKAILDASIPVMGHIGLTPQSIHMLGGYKVQGRDPEGRRRLIEQGVALEAAGCFSIVAECVPHELAAELCDRLEIPVIGIGAGPACDGQVLVLHDMLGFGMKTKFSKVYADVRSIMTEACHDYIREVKAGAFPGPEHTFHADYS